MISLRRGGALTKSCAPKIVDGKECSRSSSNTSSSMGTAVSHIRLQGIQNLPDGSRGSAINIRNSKETIRLPPKQLIALNSWTLLGLCGIHMTSHGWQSCMSSRLLNNKTMVISTSHRAIPTIPSWQHRPDVSDAIPDCGYQDATPPQWQLSDVNYILKSLGFIFETNKLVLTNYELFGFTACTARKIELIWSQ